jgi:CBS-domain-containing membrane protein
LEGINVINFLLKFKGDSSKLPPAPSAQSVLKAFLGGFIAIATIAGLANASQTAMILGSFGASCVLIFGYPDAPFSQPRNVILGHFISSLIGLLFIKIMGPHWWSVALAVGTAIAIMMLTRTVHPPAGSNPVIVFLLLSDWPFLLFPTLTGSLVLVFVALIYNNLMHATQYPKYW